jgi:predicted nuclease of predicted toxin-antitoxin system
LLLDANISWRITKSLKTEFDEVFHILDFLPHNAKDSQIWELAKSKNLIIVTNDEDFLNLSMTKGWPPKVILLKQGNQSNKTIASLSISNKIEIQNFFQNNDIGLIEFLTPVK